MCGILSAELDEWDEDDLEDERSIPFQSFTKILKRLQDTCAELSGRDVFQQSTLATLTPADFISMAIETRPPGTAASRHFSISRGLRSIELHKDVDMASREAGTSRPISAGKHHTLRVLFQLTKKITSSFCSIAVFRGQRSTFGVDVHHQKNWKIQR
jgi:hypothetical protein